jgi:hypothetical protein
VTILNFSPAWPVTHSAGVDDGAATAAVPIVAAKAHEKVKATILERHFI